MKQSATRFIINELTTQLIITSLTNDHDSNMTWLCLNIEINQVLHHSNLKQHENYCTLKNVVSKIFYIENNNKKKLTISYSLRAFLIRCQLSHTTKNIQVHIRRGLNCQMGGLDFANPIPFVHDLLIENFSVQLIIEFRRQYLSYYMIVFLLSFCTLID